MRDAFYLFDWGALGQRELIWLDSVADSRWQVGKSAGHQLASPADLPTTAKLVGERHLQTS